MYAEEQKHNEPFLPEITTNLYKQKSPQQRRKQRKESRWASGGPPQLLSKKEIAQFRNSPKQLICVELLQEGFHRSFSELFSLLGSDEDQRAAADPESARLLTPPLQEQQDKLETMKLHLSRAEEAERTGSWSVVCEQRLLLGRYFSAPEDVWLSLYFYHSCADRERGGNTRWATEARACLAHIYLQRGDLEDARQQAELCLKQAEEGGWMDSSGQPMRLRSCQTLGKIYNRLADAALAKADYDTPLELNHKGLSMATECEDKQIEGRATFQLGLTYQSSGDHDSAKQLFSTCIEIYSALQDAHGQAMTYKAMAKSSESEGNIDKTLEYLEKSADVCSSNGLQSRFADICLDLGNIYYNMNQYVRAYEYFLKSYEVASDGGDVAVLQKAQVLVGWTRTMLLIRKHHVDMESVSSGSMNQQVAWKETGGRQDLDTDSALWSSLSDQSKLEKHTELLS